MEIGVFTSSPRAVHDTVAFRHLPLQVRVIHHAIVFVPVVEKCPVGYLGGVGETFRHAFGGAGGVEDLVDGFRSVSVRNVFPERVACVGGIARREVVEIGVALRQDAVFHVRIDIAVPGFSKVGSQTAEIPVGHIHQVVVGHVGAHRRALHKPMGIHVHDTAADHPVEVGAVAIKVDVNLRAIDIGHAALIVKIVVIVCKVGLSEVLLRVIDDELQFAFGVVMQHLLNLRQDLGDLVIDILCQGLASRIVIDIILLGAHVLPVIVLVLHAVLAEADLRAVVELRPRQEWRETEAHTQQYVKQPFTI